MYYEYIACRRDAPPLPERARQDGFLRAEIRCVGGNLRVYGVRQVWRVPIDHGLISRPVKLDRAVTSQVVVNRGQ